MWTIIGNVVLIGIGLLALATLGLFIAVATEGNSPKDELEERERQAELDQASERAAARQAEQRMQLYGDWAQDRASGHVPEQRRPDERGRS